MMSTHDQEPFVETLFHLLEEKGGSRYGGEAVSQLDHALQSAMQAQAAGAGDALITAALLHDVGHLIGKGDEGLAAQGIDARHEESGAVYLERYFVEGVSEPVRLHVDAKRYLCRVDPSYWDTLSEGSKISLEVQGGVMSPTEAETFAAKPFGKEAADLRRWDDLAKDPAIKPPPLAHYRPAVLASLEKRP